MKNNSCNLEVGILYLCIHKKLEERTNLTRIMKRSDIFRIFGETFHIPKAMRCAVIKEMEDKGLVEILGVKRKAMIKINSIDIDIEKEASKLYELVGIL